MKRTIVSIILAFLFLIAVSAGFVLWQNNKEIAFPSKLSITHSHAKAISWLKKNRTSILTTNNPIIWWTLQESALLSRDADLMDIVDEFKTAELTQKKNEVWRKLFDKNASVPQPLPYIGHFQDYGWLFVYGLTCDRWLAKNETISQQLKLDYCDSRRPQSACVTHQLLGFFFMKRFGCRDNRLNEASINTLQKKIVSQLTWDIRVVDVYIQRVMMLAITGSVDKIKPVWLSRILNAQEEDGGWDNFDPLIPLRDGKYVGFTNKGIGIDRPESNLHATAQGIFLLSLLLHSKMQPAESASSK